MRKSTHLTVSSAAAVLAFCAFTALGTVPTTGATARPAAAGRAVTAAGPV
ncbi:hypothetical protein [Streptomyces goshikiensis]